MTGAERVAKFTADDEALNVAIKEAQDNLHNLLKAQHEVRREIFHAQFDARTGK